MFSVYLLCLVCVVLTDLSIRVEDFFFFLLRFVVCLKVFEGC